MNLSVTGVGSFIGSGAATRFIQANIGHTHTNFRPIRKKEEGNFWNDQVTLNFFCYYVCTMSVYLGCTRCSILLNFNWKIQAMGYLATFASFAYILVFYSKLCSPFSNFLAFDLFFTSFGIFKAMHILIVGFGLPTFAYEKMCT